MLHVIKPGEIPGMKFLMIVSYRVGNQDASQKL